MDSEAKKFRRLEIEKLLQSMGFVKRMNSAGALSYSFMLADRQQIFLNIVADRLDFSIRPAGDSTKVIPLFIGEAVETFERQRYYTIAEQLVFNTHLFVGWKRLWGKKFWDRRSDFKI